MAPNGNIFARFGKGKKKEVMLVYTGNDPQRGIFKLFKTSPLSALLAFATDEQQDRIIEIAQASRE